MKATATRKKSKNSAKPPSPRTSVTLPAEVHRKLGEIAKEKKVSLAWVVRDAAEKYVANHAPSGSPRKGAQQ